jgi:hypothetical protein
MDVVFEVVWHLNQVRYNPLQQGQGWPGYHLHNITPQSTTTGQHNQHDQEEQVESEAI